MNKVCKFAWVTMIAATALAVGCGPVGTSGETDTAGSQAPKILSAAHLGPQKAGELSADGRMIVGRGKDYVPIAEDPAALAARLQKSMAERRAVAWRIVEAMLEPQKITVGGQSFDVPLWHTWYEGKQGNREVEGKIKLFFAKLKACRAASCPKSMEEIAAETVASTDTKDLARSLTDANLARMTADLQGAGSQPENLGRGGTLYSPSFVEHILAQAKSIETCHSLRTANTDPGPSSDRFSHCLTEFPRSATMLKTIWLPLQQGVPAPRTDATAMTALIDGGSWPGSETSQAGPDKIYAVESAEGTTYGLRALHISTKDIREWMWITLWWSPSPNSDFGQDRPASIARFNGGVWANYKMCVTSSFAEGDPAPWSSFQQGQPQLAAALKATHEALVRRANVSPDRQLTTWCSNPNVETEPNNGMSNCIGCHQYASSWDPEVNRLTDYHYTLEPNPRARYPQHGRAKGRNNFPSDFTWSFFFESTPALIRQERERNPRMDW